MKIGMWMQLVNYSCIRRSGFICLFGWVSFLCGMGPADSLAVGARDPRRVEREAGPMVSVAPLLRRHGFKPVGDREERWTWRRDDDRLVFELNSRRIWWNDVICWMHEPVTQHRSGWWVDEADAGTVLIPLIRSTEVLGDAGYRRILLDPGHGGGDTGGRGPSGLLEKDLVLEITLQVAARLRGDGYEVRLTREDDRSLSLSQRVQIAADWPADLFVSIHLNSAANTAARGTETFILPAGGHRSTADQGSGPFAGAQPANRYDGPNQVLAFALQRRLLERTGNVDRGIRRARFHVLREAMSPAVLVECAFLTHPEEERRLGDPDYLMQIAEAITLGIQDYLKEVLHARIRDTD